MSCSSLGRITFYKISICRIYLAKTETGRTCYSLRLDLVALRLWALFSGGPCVPGPLAPGGPAGPGGPCVPVLLSLISFLSLSSNLLNLQNSTEETKNPSNGPVLHSYFLSSVGYWLYELSHMSRIPEQMRHCC